MTPVVTILALGVAIFLMAVLGFIGHLVDNRRAAIRKELEGFSCEWRVYGGMENEDHTVTVSCQGGEDAVFTEVQRPAGKDAPEQSSRAVPFDVLDRLFDLYEENGVNKWGELPDKEEQALDAPEVSVTFRYDGKEYCFTDRQQLPAPGLIRQVEQIISSCCQD